jgi:Icc protein
VTDAPRERHPGPVLARLPRPRADRPVRIAVVADPHVAVEGRGGWKVAHRSRERFATAVGDAAALDIDALVLAGDLTEEGRPAEFDAVDAVLDGVDSPTVAVPGNHDVPKGFDEHDSPTAAAFADRYAPDGFPYTVDLGPITLCCLDTASDPASGDLHHTWGGRVGERGREWLASVLPDIDRPVVVAHHNLGALPENPRGKWANFPLQDAERVRELLIANDVPLAITAHHHVAATAQHGPTRELLAPATCSFPQSWLLLAVGSEGTTVRLVPAADGPGQEEAYRYATTGKALGRGIAGLAADRLSRLPLDEE